MGRGMIKYVNAGTINLFKPHSPGLAAHTIYGDFVSPDGVLWINEEYLTPKEQEYLFKENFIQLTMEDELGQFFLNNKLQPFPVNSTQDFTGNFGTVQVPPAYLHAFRKVQYSGNPEGTDWVIAENKFGDIVGAIREVKEEEL